MSRGAHAKAVSMASKPVKKSFGTGPPALPIQAVVAAITDLDPNAVATDARISER
jgi:hypothetical protein